jgi:hypothetical protein
MDVVILNTLDNQSNVELLFVLRSIEKNLKGYRNIYLIGEKPQWLNDEKIIFIEHPKGDRKDVNIAQKLELICSTKKVSANFIYFTNDVILLEEKNVKDIKNYHKGEINPNQSGGYGFFLKETKEILESKGLPTLNYDTHYPFVINKTKLKKAYKEFDYENSKIGYGTRSMYGNFHKIESEQKTDCKVIKGFNKNLDYVSTDENNITKELLDFLLSKLPEKSSFEKTDFNFSKVSLKKAKEEAPTVKFTYNGKDGIKGSYIMKLSNAKHLKKVGYGNFEY